MRIKSLTIQGFRGFNEQCSIDFHERLTLVYAPNSYGKTSISEALEWLLYGVTSKVEKADSKDEYKGCYRNRHLPESLTPFVAARFSTDGGETEFRGDLQDGDSVARSVDTREVQEWPIASQLTEANKPFILQHALKYLLLAKPGERFQKFASLLGLEELDTIQTNLISLCTKPDARIPAEVAELRRRVGALEARLSAQPTLRNIDRALKRGRQNLVQAYAAILAECRSRAPAGTDDGSLLPELLKIRDDAVGKIFKGRVALADYTPVEKQADSIDGEFFVGWLTESFVTQYTELARLSQVLEVLEQARFLGLGVVLADRVPGTCPFCGQSIDDALWRHIRERHETLVKANERHGVLTRQRDAILLLFQELRSRLDTCHARHAGKCSALLALEPRLAELEPILVPKHQAHFDAVKQAISQLAVAKESLQRGFARATAAAAAIDASVREHKVDLSLAKGLGTVLLEYVAEAKTFAGVVSANVGAVSNADQVLRHEMDILAKTEDISLLIDLVERRQDIQKKLEVDEILDSLKDLRRAVDQYASNRVLQAISDELTSEVMEWYGRIRTVGDPDVHFSGFDLDRTAKGDLKSRRVQIKAASYGKDLVSAVSSLSESKLNALGLCLSIATSLKPGSPFDFLLIDDPIQSLDADHEARFVDVIRELVELDKQVILLSHNKSWMEQVRSGCRSLNGWYYEVTGYSEAGPCILRTTWAKRRERLDEVDAILKDPTASSIRLQQAEEEMRMVFAELACDLCRKKSHQVKNPATVNAAEIRKVLVECGIDARLVDMVSQAFETVDAAHHSPSGYVPNRERIRRYYDCAFELVKLLK